MIKTYIHLDYSLEISAYHTIQYNMLLLDRLSDVQAVCSEPPNQAKIGDSLPGKWN